MLSSSDSEIKLILSMDDGPLPRKSYQTWCSDE